MNGFDKTKAIAIGSSILVGLSIIWLIITSLINNSLEKKLDSQKLKFEALLSEKLILEKASRKNQHQFSALSTTNQNTYKYLKASERRLAIAVHKNNHLKQALKKAEEQNENQLTLQKSFEQRIKRDMVSYSNIFNKNQKLKDTILLLTARNLFITSELSKAKLASIDYTLIKAVKKNKAKLTARAGCTKNIIANVTLPSELRDLTFVMFDPDGERLNEHEGDIVSKVLPDINNYTASSDLNTKVFLLKTQTIEIAYERKKRLKPGTYVLKILNNDLYVGSMQIKLK